MKLYNHELEKFMAFLYNLKLVDYRSRMRTKFIRLLAEKYKEFREDYDLLIKEHARFDDKGEPIEIDVDGQTRYEIIDPNEFKLACIHLLHEEVIIDQTQERKNMLMAVKDSVLHCGIEFEGQEAIEYDRWCDLVEGINYVDMQ